MKRTSMAYTGATGVRHGPVDVCEAGEKRHPGKRSRDGARYSEILLDRAGWVTRRIRIRTCMFGGRPSL
jgi:hypothetical protein